MDSHRTKMEAPKKQFFSSSVGFNQSINPKNIGVTTWYESLFGSYKVCWLALVFGRYLVIEPTSFKKEAEEMALIFAIDVTTTNDLSLRTYCVVMNCRECIWIADCLQAGFSKGQAGLWISWRGDVWWKQWWKWMEMMRLVVRGANTSLWLRCSSTIQWSYGNTHLLGYLVPLWDHLGRVINRDFYPCNFDKSPQVCSSTSTVFISKIHTLPFMAPPDLPFIPSVPHLDLRSRPQKEMPSWNWL